MQCKIYIFPKKNRDKKEYKQTIFNHKKETFNIHLQIKTNTKIVCFGGSRQDEPLQSKIWMKLWNTILYKYNYNSTQIQLQLITNTITTNNTNPNSLEDRGRVRATSKQDLNDWYIENYEIQNDTTTITTWTTNTNRKVFKLFTSKTVYEKNLLQLNSNCLLSRK